LTDSTSLRVLHFADVHIGMENYGSLDPVSGTSTRVLDFLTRLDEVIDYAIDHQADLAVFAGDAFKNRDPDPTQQREFASRIKRLADQIPTLLLVGNHDMPGVAARASSLDIFQTLDVPNVIVGHSPDGQVVETRSGPVFLGWMPYPMRNRLLVKEEMQGKNIEELEGVLRETVSTILRKLSTRAEEHAMPRLLAGHFSVAEASFGSERSVMLGRDVAVMLSTLADPAWDYVALGHIHKHQSINKDRYPPVVYSGSLERIDFGEADETKGFSWISLNRGATSWEFIPVAAREFRTVFADLRQEANPTEALLKKLETVSADGAVVRVKIQMNSEQQTALREREVEKALSEAANVSIAREIETEVRSRLGDLAPETLSPLALVEKYFEARDESPQRIQTLLSKAEELLRDPD
jgi:DNA repair protein SbcD/Mre11